MNGFHVFAALAAVCACGAGGSPAGRQQQQQQQQQQHVPILKQVNRQNEDGSYSYGYENADGAFKIETKYPTGEVYGKYGYVDETGRLRTVEYGASSSRGFQPVGEGIDVPPPADSADAADAGDSDADGRDAEDDYDDGQYREDPGAYYKKSSGRPPATDQQRQWYDGADAGHKRQRARRPPASRPDQSSYTW